MEVPSEVEIDLLHRKDLGIATARCSPLEAKARPERGFTQSNDRLLA